MKGGWVQKPGKYGNARKLRTDCQCSIFSARISIARIIANAFYVHIPAQNMKMVNESLFRVCDHCTPVLMQVGAENDMVHYAFSISSCTSQRTSHRFQVSTTEKRLACAAIVNGDVLPRSPSHTSRQACCTVQHSQLISITISTQASRSQFGGQSSCPYHHKH